MRKAYLLVLLLSFLFIHHSFANSGFCENYAILKINGGTNTYYDLQATTGNPDFNGANLGNFNIGSNTLILNGGENKFFKCGTDAITQSYLYYRIYKTTATPGAFISSQIFYNSNVVTACNCGGTDELWNATAANINVLNGLTPGTYYLEVYANADYTYVSGSGTHYANNGAANYKATFTVTPVYVTSTTGTSPATYNTLKDAFDALNAGTHKGTIAISIYGNTTETATAQLRNSGYLGLSSYISVSIQPAGGSARTVSGNIAGELVDFYGATNVSVDGLNSGGNSLIFSNINTGNANTIRLTYNASNNIITNCTILGATTGSPNATILFYSTAIAGATTGVNNNTVSNCYIGPAASNTPRYGILSQGTSSLVNTGNNISNNNVYDYFYPTSDNGGIRLSAGNTGWTITGNRLYQTATRTFLTSVSTKIMYGISIIQNSSPGNGFTINNNVIGFGNNAGTGITSITGSANRIRGIYLLTGVSSTTTVNNNIIAGISQTTTAEPSLANDAGFIGILVDAGTVNTTSNTIGSLSSNTISVIPDPNNGTYPPEMGILYYGGSGTISSNSIGGITVTPTSSNRVVGLNGIRISNNSTVTVSGNTIGSSSAPLISNSTSNSVQNACVYLESGTATVNANKLSYLNSPSSSTGIRIYGATSTVTNNMITLGDGLTDNIGIFGIEYALGASPKIYYNSVRITGNATNGSSITQAFNSASTVTNNANVINNIFYNERTGVGSHYAINIQTAGLYTGNYNDLYVSGTKTGSYNGTPYTSLANWKTGSSQDANSIAVTAPFTSTTDLHLNDPLLTSLLLNAGTDLSPTVTTDFDGDLRRSGCGGTDIGADEVYLYSTLSSSSHVWLGKVGTNWCDPCNWENQTTPSSSNNVIIQTSVFGNNPVVTTGCVANSKNLTINSASLSVQTGGTLNIYGNFTNASTFTNTGGDVNFAGSTSQTITSTSALSFYNLNFSGGGAKSINFNATVNGTLGLSSGVVTVSSGKYLALAAGAVYTGGGSSSYINGTLRKYFSAADNGTIFRFPVGDATRYGPIELANITNAASGDYMDGSYTTGAFSGNHRNILTPVPASPTNSVLPVVFSSYVEYWNLNFSGGSSFAAKLNLYYTSNLYSQLFNKGADWLRVTRFDGTGVLDYGNDNPLADQASGSSGYISSAGLIGASAFNNIFTFGTTANGVNPLPSYFKSFTATKQTGYNKLDWNVGCNGKELTFDILRSTDGRNFQSINKFTASQSRCSQPFDFNDYTAIGQKIYYRIRITDEYGKIIYTPVAVIINRNKGFEITGLMPNPASDVVFLNISSAIKDKLQLSVTDVNGKQVISLSAVLEAGSNTVSLQVSSLAKGVYNISGIYSDGRTAALRFIKQ